MGGFFGAALKEDCVFDVFFGTDYHSHLGTRRGGLVFCGEDGFDRSIHNIENSPFRTKFENEINKMNSNIGMGCISDTEPQPLIIRSQHGTFAILTVGRINNIEELADSIFAKGGFHFLELSGGGINATELVAGLINQKDNLIDGIHYAQEQIDGSMSIMVMTREGIYCARDIHGRTPLVIGKKPEGYCAALEQFSYVNLGYEDYKELGPGEIDIITPDGVKVLMDPSGKLKICTFLWVYFGYPPTHYEGVNVELMRNRCGAALAKRDTISHVDADIVAGVPDSGIAHAVGYSNESGIPFARPFIKYTPTWPRSFMPTIQKKRNLIAKMKLIPVKELILGKRMVLIDDSIVRGTQLGKTAEFLYKNGTKELHVRPACPPIMYGCKYLNFSRATTEMELMTRRIIRDEEGENLPEDILSQYSDPDSDRYHRMLEVMCERLGFTSLAFNRLDDMLEAVGIPVENLCTYCFDGRQ